MPLLYVTTLFLGAMLLFAVQPMVGRMLTPQLGGSPAVWNTCLVFFQGVLLLGYLYSHLSTRYLSLRLQARIHLASVAAIAFALPITISRSDPPSDLPALWLLSTLFLSVGLPFFAVSTTSPLLQRWYVSTRAVGSSDPYFLSVASNTGCLAALVAYPLIIEPSLRLAEQSEWWRWGYLAYVGLVAMCGAVMWRQASRPAGVLTSPEPQVDSKPLGTQRWRWLILAFVPSSLLVGVTNSITTDISPIPLLWVIPLALYLLTFIIAFTPGIKLPLGRLGKILAMCVLFLSLALLAGATEPLWLVLALHLVTFFVAGLVCHGRLAAERPPAEHLTSFYLWMSLGGVLGGAFNTLVAPLIFHRIGFVEYPLALLVVCLLRPATAERWAWRWTDLAFPLILGLVTVATILVSGLDASAEWLKNLAEQFAMTPDMVRRTFCFGLPLVIGFFFVERPLRFSLGLGALFLASMFFEGAQGRVLHLERNFLGVVKVTSANDGELTRMVHGNTVHGQQRNISRPRYTASFLQTLGATSALNEAMILAASESRWDDRHRPLTYYHPSGPAGITFRYLVDGWEKPRIGAVGLGTGAIASYARPDQKWTFFELDPAVERLARDAKYFTFLRDSPAARSKDFSTDGSMDVVLGDARLMLAKEPDQSFNLLVLDAFSSDAIPVHLLTAEAFALYERKLAPNGVILMHLSNRYLDLVPVVARIAETANPPLIVRENNDLGISDREAADGKYPSIWVVLARKDEDFGPLSRPVRGFLPVRDSQSPRWTDDRADLLRAFRRGEE